MNILVVNYEYPPIGGGGGSSCKEIVERLSQRGHNVHVFTAGYKQFKKIESITDHLTIYKIKSNRKSVHEVGFFGLVSFILRGSFKIGKFIKKGHFDIIHYHFSVPTGLLTYFHTDKIPYVITLHGIDVPGFHEDEFPAFQKITRPFNKRIIKKAGRVIAVSQNLKEKALETFHGTPIDIIYHGVDTDIFKKINSVQKDHTIRFICIARLVRFKRIDILLQAYKMFLEKQPEMDSELVIVGTGYMENELKLLADKLGISHKTVFKGFVQNTEIPELLNSSDVFVLPSVHDSFGIVFLEAMACGLPCIGARSAGVPEVIRDRETGLLAIPESSESLKDCMIELAQDKTLRKNMGEAGYHLVQNCYTWNKIVGQYENVFDEVIKNKHTK